MRPATRDVLTGLGSGALLICVLMLSARLLPFELFSPAMLAQCLVVFVGGGLLVGWLRPRAGLPCALGVGLGQGVLAFDPDLAAAAASLLLGFAFLFGLLTAAGAAMGGRLRMRAEARHAAGHGSE